MTTARRIVGEFTGTAFLLAAIVWSGIMGVRLAEGNAAIALLANSLATGAALVALILCFAPISGAHFNPLVTLAAASQGAMMWRLVPGYLAAQISGAFAGVALSNIMFGLPPFFFSTRIREGEAQFLSEFLATFGLMLVILICSRYQPTSVPYAVAAYVTAAYWLFSSTSFANPAVTMARSMTDTFSGIRPVDVPMFVLAQLMGGSAGVAFSRWLSPKPTAELQPTTTGK